MILTPNPVRHRIREVQWRSKKWDAAETERFAGEGRLCRLLLWGSDQPTASEQGQPWGRGAETCLAPGGGGVGSLSLVSLSNNCKALFPRTMDE